MASSGNPLKDSGKSPIKGIEAVRNRLDWESFSAAVETSKILPDTGARFQKSDEKAYKETPENSEGEFAVFTKQISVGGLRFPPSSEAIEMLNYFEISPSQLTTTSWLLRNCFFMLCQQTKGVSYSLELFRYVYELESVIGGGQSKDKPACSPSVGFLNFRARQMGGGVIANLPSKVPDWKESWLFMKDLGNAPRTVSSSYLDMLKNRLSSLQAQYSAHEDTDKSSKASTRRASEAKPTPVSIEELSVKKAAEKKRDAPKPSLEQKGKSDENKGAKPTAVEREKKTIESGPPGTSKGKAVEQTSIGPKTVSKTITSEPLIRTQAKEWSGHAQPAESAHPYTSSSCDKEITALEWVTKEDLVEFPKDWINSKNTHWARNYPQVIGQASSLLYTPGTKNFFESKDETRFFSVAKAITLQANTVISHAEMLCQKYKAKLCRANEALKKVESELLATKETLAQKELELTALEENERSFAARLKREREEAVEEYKQSANLEELINLRIKEYQKTPAFDKLVDDRIEEYLDGEEHQ
ncbi:hypothetical protein CRG98_014828 [Punica granatum]|uniref:Transposase (putative) gypsy type domain-containing protein n=1 Tax=Punica granatum TaxID=22663 RepID=A0A2I0K889_PUNGR|nr:hypothetical protein CRG98_014828 [Punica granatum]